MDWFYFITSAIKIVSILFCIILPMVAYSVYAERRFSAILQDRVGPNRVGIPMTDIRLFGLGQPIADGLKFILKEDFTPGHVNKVYYWLAPALVMVPALITAAVVPFGSPLHLTWGGEPVVVKQVIADLNVGPLFVFAIASLSVYGIFLAGWSSNSKYPFLGGVRSSSQMISYEICLGLSLIPALIFYGHLNLSDIVTLQSQNGWLLLPFNFSGEGPVTTATQIFFLIPAIIAFIVFTASIFAETNRTPFDLPECETELVAGYHTEYSSMKFALFFLGEYAAMIVGSAIIVTLFLGGWALPFGLDNLIANPDGSFPWWMSLAHVGIFLSKVIAFILFFILVRWTVPRFRYDQLMKLGWVVFFEYHPRRPRRRRPRHLPIPLRQ